MSTKMETAVEKLLEEIKDNANLFLQEGSKKSKQAHLRARKASSTLTKLLKEYRTQSIVIDKLPK